MIKLEPFNIPHLKNVLEIFPEIDTFLRTLSPNQVKALSSIISNNNDRCVFMMLIGDSDILDSICEIFMQDKGGV